MCYEMSRVRGSPDKYYASYNGYFGKGGQAMSNGSVWNFQKRIILLLPIVFGIATAVEAQDAGDPIPNSYICVFKPGPISAGAEARQSVAAVGGRVDRVYSSALRGFSATMSETALNKMLQMDGFIDYCEQDRYATIPEPSDGSAQAARGKPGGGGGGATTETTPWGVSRVGSGSGVGKTAWVIDSGIDLTHPDLRVEAETSNGGRSKSFLIRDPSADDANGHGTHVAGTIAAIGGNGRGVVGVAEGATVVALRVLDRRGSGPNSGVIDAINYAVSNGRPGDVINLSLITSYMQSMNDAVAGADAAGFFVAIAAGNSAVDASDYSPASAEGPNVYTVSAIEQGDKWAFYSNFGAPVDYAEPGSSIYSTDKDGGYSTKSGTSMAAPHMAGILLLNGGVPNSGGAVSGEPDDGRPDPIGIK